MNLRPAAERRHHVPASPAQSRQRLVALAAALACCVVPPLPAVAQDGAAAVAALAAPAERQDIRAQLLPQRYTTLAAEIGARINRLVVVEGAAFKKGQQLVGFDCSVQQALLRRAKAEQSAAQETHVANQRLAELNSVGQLELALSAAAVTRAGAEVGVQGAVLSKCSIAAPFAGRVAVQHVREQQFVQPGEALLDVIDDSSLQLEFLVPSAWLTGLRSGDAFEVAIDETGRRYPAHIIRFGARVDPVSQSLKVVAVIDGEHPELIAGMSGQVLIEPPARP